MISSYCPLLSFCLCRLLCCSAWHVHLDVCALPACKQWTLSERDHVAFTGAHAQACLTVLFLHPLLSQQQLGSDIRLLGKISDNLCPVSHREHSHLKKQSVTWHTVGGSLSHQLHTNTSTEQIHQTVTNCTEIYLVLDLSVVNSSIPVVHGSKLDLLSS